MLDEKPTHDDGSGRQDVVASIQRSPLTILSTGAASGGRMGGR
jgi:hypothetical protein